MDATDRVLILDITIEHILIQLMFLYPNPLDMVIEVTAGKFVM